MGRLFTGVVKIRKGMAARLMLSACDGQDAVHWWFAHFAEQLSESVRSGACSSAEGPIGERLSRACARITGITAVRAQAHEERRARVRHLLAGSLVLMASVLAACSIWA